MMMRGSERTEKGNDPSFVAFNGKSFHTGS